MNRRIRMVVALSLVAAVAGASPKATEGPRASAAMEGIGASPTDELLTAFDRFDVVAVADMRGVEQLADLYAAVAASDALAERGVEIVADFGGAAHQRVVDAYLAGEQVSETGIRTIVSSSPAFAQGGAPRSYDTLLAAMRQANARRQASQRVRLWLPRVDVVGQSAALASRVLERLEAGKKVLLIADPLELLRAGLRIMRMGGPAPGSMASQPRSAPAQSKPPTVTVSPDAEPDSALDAAEPQPTCLQRIEQARPGRATTILPYCGIDDPATNQRIETEIAARGVGSLTPLKGAEAAAVLRAFTGRDLASGMLGGPIMAGMDALLYVGPVSSLTVAPVRKSEKAILLTELAARRPTPTIQMRGPAGGAVPPNP